MSLHKPVALLQCTQLHESLKFTDPRLAQSFLFLCYIYLACFFFLFCFVLFCFFICLFIQSLWLWLNTFLFRQGSEVNNFDRLCKICIPYKKKKQLKKQRKGLGPDYTDPCRLRPQFLIQAEVTVCACRSVLSMIQFHMQNLPPK